MCIEDLRLAKGKQLGQGVSVTASSTTTPTLPANANRVAVKITPMTLGTGSSVILCLDPGHLQGIYEAYDTNVTSRPYTIEEMGEAITGPLWASFQGVGGVFWVQEIVSYVNAPPLSNYVPK